MSHLCESKDLVAPFGPSPAGASTILDDITTVFGVGSTIASIAGAIGTIVGGGIYTAIVIALLVRGSGFAITLIAAIYLYRTCIQSSTGPLHCVAGIVSRIEPGGTKSGPFKFTVQHPNFDVITTCRYWDTVIASGDPDYIHYNTDSREGSPILRVYTYSQRVCDIAGWSTFGTAIGAAVGAALFDIIASAAAAACASAGPFCLIFGIIAAIVVAMVLAIGGGELFGAIADEASSEPSPNPNVSNEGVLLHQLVTVKGALVQSIFDGGANVFRYAQKDDDLGAEPPSFGTWGPVNPPYSHVEADAAFIIDQDNGTEVYREDVFCGRSELQCIDFAYYDPDIVLDSPTTLNYSWQLLTDTGNSMRLVTWGEPIGTVKLFLRDDPVRIIFDRPVSRVTAEVGWEGGNPVELKGFDSNIEVGSAQSPQVKNTIHLITINAQSIDEIVFTAQEGLVIRVCVE